jgi:hypothetical protein
MTDEDIDINVKICKILDIEPWKPIHELVFGPGKGEIIDYRYIGPDYCNDLNAMQDVWNWCCQVTGTEHLDSLHWEGIRSTYGEKLEECAWNKCARYGGARDYVIANLTAKEKALCFVSSMNTSGDDK